MNATLKCLAVLVVFLAGATAAQAQDAQRGARKVAMCKGCHQIEGYQADFPMVYKVPKISGQDPQYLVSALTAYRSGDRKFATMRAIAATLSDQDIADIAAYYSQLGTPAEAPKSLDKPVPTELQAKVAACSGCHGQNFSTPTAANIPRLAGQYADYLYQAYRAYTVEGNPHFGRANAMMTPMGKMLSDSEAKQFTAYLAELPGELRTVQDPRFK